MSLTIEVPERPEDPGLFVVNFVNGEVNLAAQSKPKFSLYHKSNDRSKRRKIMVAEAGQLAYAGTNYDADSISSGANMCKYYVGAVDREKGTMSLHRTELFSLRPCISGTSGTDVLQESPSKRERAEISHMMVSSFGSERQKRAYAAAKRNMVEADTLKSALATAVTHAEEEVGGTTELGSQSMQGSGLMPPCNTTAERPQDVYNISDIIALDELKVLKKTAKVFLSATSKDLGQWKEEKSYPVYVLDHTHFLPANEPHRSLKSAFLLYASYLIQMYTFNPKWFEKRGLGMLTGVPPPTLVKDKLLAKFTERREEGGGRFSSILSRRMKDKILSHLCVLALFIDNFSVDCTTLQQDLRLSTSKFIDHFRALGCRVTSVKRKSTGMESSDPPSCKADLSIPLIFPRQRKGKKRVY